MICNLAKDNGLLERFLGGFESAEKWFQWKSLLSGPPGSSVSNVLLLRDARVSSRYQTFIALRSLCGSMATMF